MYKRLVSGVLIAALLIFLGYREWQGDASETVGAEAPLVLVRVATVEVRDMPIVVSVFGSLRAYDAAHIASEVNGNVTEIFFNEGQSVAAGAPLIQIDDAAEQASLLQASAELELNTAEYQRMTELVAKKAVSQQSVDQAKAELDVSAAALDIARVSVDSTLIKSPFAGVLGARKLSVGQYVTMGEPLVDIFNRTQLKLEYSVPERFLSQVALGQTVEITTKAYPDVTFTGVVNFISPAVDVATRTLAVEALIDNADGRLSPGLSVRVTHILGMTPNALVIPEESLLPSVAGYNVYLIKEGVAVSQAVTLDSRVKGFVHIAKGVNAGETIVISGQEKLRDGASVEIAAEDEV